MHMDAIIPTLDLDLPPPDASGPSAVLTELSFSMRTADFGGEQETRRDAARTFSAGGIFLLAEGELRSLTALPQSEDSPKQYSPGSTEAVANDRTVAAMVEALRLALPHAVSDAVVERLLPMLTVNPVLQALDVAGIPPSLQACCYVLISRRAADASLGHVLQCIALGRMPAPPSDSWGLLVPRPVATVLLVRSPDLLVPPPEWDARAYELTYARRPTRRERLEEEVLDEPDCSSGAHDASVAAPPAAESASLCTTALVRSEGRYVLRTIKDATCRGCAVCAPHRVMDL